MSSVCGLFYLLFKEIDLIKVFEEVVIDDFCYLDKRIITNLRIDHAVSRVETAVISEWRVFPDKPNIVKIKVRRSHATAKNKNPRTSSKQSRYEYLECSTTRSSVNSIFLLEFEEISGVHLNRANSLEVCKKIFKKGFFITVSLMTCKIERKFSPSSFLMSHSLHVVFSINLFFLFFSLFLCWL